MIFIHDFFQDGRLDVLAEVRILQSYGQWTKAKRARWIKHAVTCREQTKRTHPLGSSYYAGRIAGLKSAITARFPAPRKETCSLMTFLALTDEKTMLCRACGDEAVWKCTPNRNESLILFLCDRCKQERVREQTAYITPDGWDWDEHEDQLLPLPVPVGNKLTLLEEMALELAPMTFPSAFLLGFSLSHVLWPTINIAFIPGLCIILLVRWQSANMVRFLFWFYRLTAGENG